MKLCNAKDCDREVNAKGYCDKHYRRLKKTGTTEKPKFIQKKCYSIECKKDAKAKGLCDMHYRRLKTTGKTEPSTRIKPVCKIENCKKPHAAKEFCRTHYEMTRQNIIIDQRVRLMIDNHRGLCDICKTDIPGFGRRNLSVDHDHKTGIVRGMLCQKCNIGLGNFNDSPDLLEKAIKYLLK
jgi:hypothetical protein